MAHYAEIENGIVTRILVVDNSIEDGNKFLSEELGLGGEWVPTSYNTREGVHYGPDGKPDGAEQVGFNYAAIGYSWDGVGFYAPQPYPSWTLDKTTYTWKPPVEMPTSGGPYTWDEETKAWVLVSL